MSLELSMGFFYLLCCSIFGSCSPMQCVRVRMWVCVFSPIKYHSGIWTICADRTGARSALWSLSCCCCCCYLDWFILWHLQIRSTRSTVHSAEQESVSKRARASLCFIAATFSVIVSTLCRQSARIFRLCVCVCMKIHLSSAALLLPSSSSSSLLSFTFLLQKRTEVEHAGERERR